MFLIKGYICWWKESWCCQNARYNNKEKHLFCWVSVLVVKAFRSVLFCFFLEFERFTNSALLQSYLYSHIFITNTHHTCHVAISVLQVTFCNIYVCIRSLFIHDEIKFDRHFIAVTCLQSFHLYHKTCQWTDL